MKFVIAPDSYKGSLSAIEVAEAIAAGIGQAHERVVCPLADGGEGTTAVLGDPFNASLRILRTDIKPSGVDVPVFDLGGYPAALIESARFIGLLHPDMTSLPLRRRGSTALGRAMMDVLDHGVETLVVALGGTATHEVGIGLLTALGARFSDASGRPVTEDLDGLMAVEAADLSGLTRFAKGRLIVLCDVETPLVGPEGATRVFAPQKGLADAEIGSVEAAVERFVGFCSVLEGADGGARRSGAAGGLGFALALLGGERVSGADWIIERSGLGAALVGADWLITGEGRSDAQTLAGKLPLRAASLANSLGVRSALISGSIDPDSAPVLGRWFDRQYSAGWPDGRPATAARISEVAAGLTGDRPPD